MSVISRKQIDHVEKLLRRIGEARGTSQRRFLTSTYLGSFDATMSAVAKAHSKMRPNRRPAEAKLEAIASGLDAFKGTEEPVLVHWKPKNSHPYYRAVFEFGIKHRALQQLVGGALAELLELHPDQYLLHGGVHEAIRQTSKALSAGLQWGVELDISNCYQSFDGNELTKLIPLPKEVTENIILSAHLNLVPGNIWHFFGPEDDHEGDPITLKAALSSARLGISQGSAASPLVAEAMIAIALENIPNLGVNIAYADNVLLLAKSESDVVSMTEALLAALKAHPVGRLRPRRKVFKPGQPIRYLGHVLSPLNDLVRIDPSERKLQEFVVRAASLIARAQKPSPSPHVRANRIEAAEEYVRSWTASFKLCNGIQKLRDQWLSKIPVA